MGLQKNETWGASRRFWTATKKERKSDQEKEGEPYRGDILFFWEGSGYPSSSSTFPSSVFHHLFHLSSLKASTLGVQEKRSDLKVGTIIIIAMLLCRHLHLVFRFFSFFCSDFYYGVLWILWFDFIFYE